MDDALQREMLSYYEQRAREHDLVYDGRGPAMAGHAGAYVEDVEEVRRLAADFGRGHLLDVACGTGFWAPHYAGNVEQVTFLDQSAGVLSECRRRVEPLGLAARFVRGNLFEVDLPRSAFDCALAGFLISHLDDEQLSAFFARLREVLRPGADLLLIDSLWSARREGSRRRAGVEERALEDGRRFRVYKRYFEPRELVELLEREGFVGAHTWSGQVMLAAAARRHEEPA